jgi:anti-sigma B factor antagonist
MNLTTDRNQGVSIIRVNEPRLMYPILSEFASTVTSLIGSGERKLLLDMSTVTYVDSATIGCLMDLYRQASAAGGTLKLAGVQKRVETMLTMTGAQNFLEIHADEASAVKSFGAKQCGPSRRPPVPKSCSTATCSPSWRRCIARSRRARS